MATEAEKMGLYLDFDDEARFLDWRKKMCGATGESNMEKLADAIATKVDKEAGMGLSEANFTAAEKEKLAGITFAQDDEIHAILTTIFGGYIGGGAD